MGDGLKRLTTQQKQTINTNNLITRATPFLPSNTGGVGSLQTFFEYPEKVIGSPHHTQPSAVDLHNTITTKNQNSSTFYYYQQSDYQLFGGGGLGGFGDQNDVGGGDSSSYLPTYDSIFGQFRDDDDDRDRRSNSWLHLKTILTMFFAKRK